MQLFRDVMKSITFSFFYLYNNNFTSHNRILIKFDDTYYHLNLFMVIIKYYKKRIKNPEKYKRDSSNPSDPKQS